jgi:hypothetical protein
MDKRTSLEKGFPALLKESEKSPVTITYRGIDDRSRPLYELKNRTGEVLVALGTDKQMLETLIKREKEIVNHDNR